MGPAAERMRGTMGYVNMIHVPCWGHLFSLVGNVVFANKLLPEAAEYMRLTRFGPNIFEM